MILRTFGSLLFFVFHTVIFATDFNKTSLALGDGTPIYEKTISYDDLMNKNSALWHRLKNQASQDGIVLLLGKPVQESLLTIQDVPGLAQQKTFLKVHLSLGYQGLVVRIVDSNKNSCIDGSLSLESKSAYLGYLRITPQYGSVLGLGEQKRLITGTTAVSLWDKLWEFFGLTKGTLCDASVYEGFYLRILMPYISGHSWYANFGYFPQGVTKEAYLKAVSFLCSRKVKDIIDDCQNFPEGLVLLNNALAWCNLTEKASIKTLVCNLYERWRYGKTESIHQSLTSDERARSKEFLKSIYELFLASYPTNNQEVREAQSVMSWNNQLEKII